MTACQAPQNTRSKDARPLACDLTIQFGLWLSLVERLVRDQEAVGSNPTSPIIFVVKRRNAWAPATFLLMNEAVFTTIAITGFRFFSLPAVPRALAAVRAYGARSTVEPREGPRNRGFPRERTCALHRFSGFAPHAVRVCVT